MPKPVSYGAAGWSEWLAWVNEMTSKVSARDGGFTLAARARYDAVMDRKIATRLINALINQGIDPTGDLAELRLIPDAEIEKWPSIGKASLAGLRALAPYDGNIPAALAAAEAGRTTAEKIALFLRALPTRPEFPDPTLPGENDSIDMWDAAKLAAAIERLTGNIPETA